MSNSEHGDGGLRKGLTSYGDRDFSLFLRKAFIKGAGYSAPVAEQHRSALRRPWSAVVSHGYASARRTSD